MIQGILSHSMSQKVKDAFFCYTSDFTVSHLTGGSSILKPLLELPNAYWNLVPLKGTD